VGAPSHAGATAEQAWPAFVLVAGLLVIGALAAADGLFVFVGAWISRLPGSALHLLVALLVFEACVTAVLNLDTAVVFLTPVLVRAARQRGIDEEPFLYGAVFMANSASLLLPGSNLTNLIVLTREHVPGHVFAARMLAGWVSAVIATIGVLVVIYRRRLQVQAEPDAEHADFTPGLGTAGVISAVGLVLILHRPAVPVFGVAVGLTLLAGLRPQAVISRANPLLLTGVFAVAIALGTLARSLEFLANLTETLGRWSTVGVAAGASILINNPPAAVVLSAHAPAHPRALLVGLDLGPNLAVTGSLSAILWIQVARSIDSQPSARHYTKLGLVLVPITIASAVLALRLFVPIGF